MSKRLGAHLALAIVWCLLAGSFSGWNLLGGLLVGLFVISMYARATGGPGYAGRLLSFARFGLWFFGVLVRSNLEIAREIVTPGWSQSPRIIRYDVEGLTEEETTVLSSSMTLTPGTLAVDVSPDGKFLYLHCMYARDREQQVREIDALRERLERWVFRR
jgi:multicomponent Na+:H+ antiporter subunit E